MPITPFLAGKVFPPELIEQMSTAFVRTCDALRLQLIDDAATRLVAQTIIELAERGLSDAETLLELTLQEFEVGKE